MNETQAQKPQGWDKRAWIAAGILSAPTAMLLLLLTFVFNFRDNDNTPEISQPNFLNALEELYVVINLSIFGLAVLVSVACAPFVLGFMARRGAFFWGLLPSVFWNFLWFLFGVIKPISHAKINDLTPAVWQTVDYSVVASAFVVFIRFARSIDWL